MPIPIANAVDNRCRMVSPLLNQVKPFGMDIAHSDSEAEQGALHRIHHRLWATDEDLDPIGMLEAGQMALQDFGRHKAALSIPSIRRPLQDIHHTQIEP